MAADASESPSAIDATPNTLPDKPRSSPAAPASTSERGIGPVALAQEGMRRAKRSPHPGSSHAGLNSPSPE
jgi:hypothetical protein